MWQPVSSSCPLISLWGWGYLEKACPAGNSPTAIYRSHSHTQGQSAVWVGWSRGVGEYFYDDVLLLLLLLCGHEINKILFDKAHLEWSSCIWYWQDILLCLITNYRLHICNNCNKHSRYQRPIVCWYVTVRWFKNFSKFIVVQVSLFPSC